VAARRSGGAVAALLALGAAWGQSPPLAPLRFSHRLHLEGARAACADCHAAASASVKAADRNLPSSASCLRCHDGRRAARVDAGPLDRVILAARQIRFNHKLHLSLGNVAPVLAAAIDQGKHFEPSASLRFQLETKDACLACHRGLHHTEAATPANLPRMADCVVCHDRIDPPFSCRKCHVEESRLKPATHTTDYLGRHSHLRLDKPSCRVCHGVGFRCMGCH